MNKTFGAAADFALVKDDGTRTIIGYGMEPIAESDNATWFEIYFAKKQGKPSFEQVKAAIIADINERVKALIIGGFVWNDKPVWLSEENQMNFAQAVCPVTLKIGEQADGTPIYQEFANQEEMQAFTAACVAWKQQCLAAGWAEKDGMDWAPYEQALNPQPEPEPEPKSTKKSKK